MKKKLLALFLVFTFVCAFTTSSFANAGYYRSISIRPEGANYIYLPASDNDSGDDDLGISIILTKGTENVHMKVEVQDKTTGQIIETRYPRSAAVFYEMKNLCDPTHNHKIIITNLGSDYIKGDVVTALK